MRIKTDQYGFFYKRGNKWLGPTFNETFTLKYIKDEYGSIENFKKDVARQLKRKVVLLRHVWIEK